MKIETLTKEQEEKLPVYLNKWLEIGRSTQPIDREACKESVEWCYEFAGHKETPYMWFCDSPMQMQLLINILKDEKLLGENLGDNLWESLRENLRESLRENLGDNIGDNLRAHLWENLRAHLRENLGENLRDNLWANLWENLGENLSSDMQLLINILKDEKLLGENLRNNLRANLRAHLWENLRGNLDFNYFFSPNTETWWVGFYDFILHELFPDRVGEFKEFSINCRKFYKDVYIMIPFKNICFISERPTDLGIDLETGHLHNSVGPAMKFKDGYEVYALHNIRIEKKMLNYSPKEIMAVENVEQRLVLIKNYGVENMLAELGGKVEDSFRDYKLHSILLEGEREKLLEMQNPSEPKKHFEFVPPEIETCQDALAWRFGLKVYKQPTMEA